LSAGNLTERSPVLVAKVTVISRPKAKSSTKCYEQHLKEGSDKVAELRFVSVFLHIARFMLFKSFSVV
jgi:hypothetical protein